MPRYDDWTKVASVGKDVPGQGRPGSAGIKRYRVGNMKELYIKSSCFIMTPSHVSREAEET